MPGVFFTESSSLSKGARAEAYLTIGASLGLALVADMERNNMFASLSQEIESFQNGIASIVEIGKEFVDS